MWHLLETTEAVRFLTELAVALSHPHTTSHWKAREEAVLIHFLMQ
jgi:hypothetical protein